MTNLITITEIEQEPRIQDIVLGRALGLKRSRSIRQVIDQNMSELLTYGRTPLVMADEKIGCTTRKTESYYLNEPQALLICMFSRTEKAAQVRKEVIDAYIMFKNKIESQQPDLIPVSAHTRRLPSAPREIVLSEKARSEIGGIVKKCCAVAIKDALKELVSAFDKETPKISVFDERFEPAEREAYNAILAYGKHMKGKGMTIGVLEAKDYILSGRYEKERIKWEKINF